jgi:FkbM family methyltransferase
MFPIIEVLGQPLPPIKIIDVGAMNVGADTYAALTRSNLATVIGFEPIQEECEKLNAAGGRHTFLPYAIGDGTPQVFHLCNFAMTSSIYEPNTELTSLFQNLEELMRVVSRITVETHRLDDIEQVRGGDFLKLDVQGAELDVLKGAPRTLQDVLIIQTEVEFVPLYKNQPLFADVDQHLRAAGFVFHRFLGVAGRTFKPLLLADAPHSSASQTLWADAIYVRDFTRLSSLSPAQSLKLAAILHEVYHSYDLAHLILRHHHPLAADAYLRRLTNPSLTH